jgi:hypothetical protein
MFNYVIYKESSNNHACSEESDVKVKPNEKPKTSSFIEELVKVLI